MCKFILMIFLAIVSNSALAAFTCEKIKDKATRASCIEDRVANGKNPAVVNNGKADITPQCSLNGYGVADCTFKNSGNTKGSYCGYIALIPKPNRHPILFSAFNNKKIADNFLNALKNEAKLNLKGSGKINFSHNDDVSKYVGMLNSGKVILGKREICSGIVEAGDIRKTTAEVPFFENNLMSRPSEACGPSELDGGTWTDLCSFTLFTSNEVITNLNDLLKLD